MISVSLFALFADALAGFTYYLLHFVPRLVVAIRCKGAGNLMVQNFSLRCLPVEIVLIIYFCDLFGNPHDSARSLGFSRNT